MEDYSFQNPTYDQDTFQRRFCIQRSLFIHIVKTVTTNDLYFQQRHNATGRQGLSLLKKYRTYAGLGIWDINKCTR